MAPSTGDKRGREGNTDGVSRGTSVSPPPVKRKIQGSASQQALAEFFKPSSQKQKSVEKVTWRIIEGSLLIGTYTTTAAAQDRRHSQQRKIAAFDFDATLITPSSGLKHGRDASDWKWWHNKVPATLKRLHQEGYDLVILSNQAGINLPGSLTTAKSKTAKGDLKRYHDFRQKVNSVFAQLDLPITLYAATEKDRFRKPRTGMWLTMLADLDPGQASDVDGIAWDVENSIFVGDAGGRLASSTTFGALIQKDFAISDRNFAVNVGVRYKTPEEFFLGEAPRRFESKFNPQDYIAVTEGREAIEPKTALKQYSRQNELDIVVIVGSPGAGKSTFYWRHLKPLGYERVNQDILKSRDRCVAVAKEQLSRGKSVAVDNTNATPDVRAVYVKLAQSLGIPIRCINLTTPMQLCEHNDAVRAMNVNSDTLNPEERTILPGMAFGSFAKRYVEPVIEEGFQDVVTVDFTFQGSDEDQAIWSRYWI